ncbi:hypothetical protein HMPREF3224_02597, partial [Anaerococcus hydrogenalis]
NQLNAVQEQRAKRFNPSGRDGGTALQHKPDDNPQNERNENARR